ncbi:MAG: hypothetical protein JWN00_562 [Actinomycetia bacterium]|nr:hypothetical protein [Actinomycetes bacterium]
MSATDKARNKAGKLKGKGKGKGTAGKASDRDRLEAEGMTDMARARQRPTGERAGDGVKDRSKESADKGAGGGAHAGHRPSPPRPM